jgi:hypothetical protein
MITLTPKLIGKNPNDNTLDRYRQAQWFIPTITENKNSIKVFYIEYDQTANGTKCNIRNRFYVTTDDIAVSDEKGIIINADAGHFTAWANFDLSGGLGAGVTLKVLFESSINGVLASIPMV